MKRRPKSEVQSRREPVRAAPADGVRSAKAAEIVALVETLSGEFGARDGVHLGKGVARLLASAYRRRGRTPTWVKELVAHYGRRPG